MRVLREGMQGVDIIHWQNFLIGQGLYDSEADGKFGLKTTKATVAFQEAASLRADGVVGDKTYGAAMLRGYGVTEDSVVGEDSKNWPPKPTWSPLMSTAERQRLFGVFQYEPAPTAGNPEGIRILGKWANENIRKVPIPQLAGIEGAPRDGVIYFHKAGVDQLVGMWAAWEKAGLLELVLGWAGSWVPRFVRGSRETLSNHAFGTAFDINVPWNMLGAVPALVGRKGSVRKLVPIANDFGFFWGGHFSGRPDGMHFELSQIK